jgi:signal transduction histidine kinase
VSVKSDLVSVVVGPGQPGVVPARPRWLRPYAQPILLVLTLLLALAARSGVQTSGSATQFIAILGTIPLALVTVRPMYAWRIAIIVAVLGNFFPVAHATAWAWAPVSVLIYLLTLFAVAATQSLTVAIVTWVASGVVVVYGAVPSNQVGIIILLTLIALGGDQVRRRRKAQAALAAESERGVVLTERGRIARELHDVVAHHMSMIAVRAETAPYRLTDLPDDARAEFISISSAAREGLVEMRRLLGVLRSEGQEADTAPQPSIEDVAELVATSRKAGADVVLTQPDDVGTVPPAVGLTAYRIVQEALSNAGRHAPGASTGVVLERTGEGLSILVRNGPGRRPSPPGGPGHGLRGMRERVTMLGGALAAGAEPDGGYTVRAVLPLTDVPRRKPA